MYDLIPFPEKVKTLFILESPHNDEIELKYPVAGESGKNMARVILGNNSIPFGKLLFDKSPSVAEYGIFNSCHFPLGLLRELTEEQKEIAGLKSVYRKDKGRNENYGLFEDFLSKIDNLDGKLNYSERLNKIINASESIETLVFCGYIAQAIFLRLSGYREIPPYNRILKITAQDTSFNIEKNILFVNHPSEKSGSWVYRNR